MGIKDLRDKGRKLRANEKPPDNVVTLVPRPIGP
ncbi:hypothetical protein LCGC14_2936020, partial [marine sediment metagenome]